MAIEMRIFLYIKAIMFKIKKNKKAFSLLESILSVFLVSMGLVVAIKLLTLGVSQSMKNRDQFTASLLAQEGVELVRNIRDNNWVDNDPGTGSFCSPDDASNACIGKCTDDTGGTRYGITIDINGYHNCGSTTEAFRKVCLDSNGYYVNNKDGGTCASHGLTDTKFSRRIYSYSAGVGSNARTITSVVIWGKNWPWSPDNAANNVSNFPSLLSGCNTDAKCTYTQITLNRWGE
jgi:Tfp pilus assembly protein PilV